jgi:hypothetical protein
MMMVPLLLLLGIALMIPPSDPSVLYRGQQCWIGFRDDHGRRLRCRRLVRGAVAAAANIRNDSTAVVRFVRLLAAVASSLAVPAARTAAVAPASRRAPNDHPAGGVGLPHGERICGTKGEDLMLRKAPKLGPRVVYSGSKLEGNLPMQQVFTQPRAFDPFRSWQPALFLSSAGAERVIGPMRVDNSTVTLDLTIAQPTELVLPLFP